MGGVLSSGRERPVTLTDLRAPPLAATAAAVDALNEWLHVRARLAGRPGRLDALRGRRRRLPGHVGGPDRGLRRPGLRPVAPDDRVRLRAGLVRGARRPGRRGLLPPGPPGSPARSRRAGLPLPPRGRVPGQRRPAGPPLLVPTGRPGRGPSRRDGGRDEDGAGRGAAGRRSAATPTTSSPRTRGGPGCPAGTSWGRSSTASTPASGTAGTRRPAPPRRSSGSGRPCCRGPPPSSPTSHRSIS